MWLILQLDEPDDFVCATGVSHSVLDLVKYVFGKLNLDWQKFVSVNSRYFRPEELHNLKGDSTKLRQKTNWKPFYTFETMLDEMVEYWLEKLAPH
jgi:GDPmannose 4,6-dehydratase